MMIPSDIKSLILDMDGVLWKGDESIGDLPRIFRRINEIGLKYVFATNNGSRTPEQYVARLAGFGVIAESHQIITSAQTLAHLLKQRFPSGGAVYAIGELGVMDALLARGFSLLSFEKAADAQAVVFGIDREITFKKISEAALLVRRGIPFYATNSDRTFPTPLGEIPGTGAWVSILTTATNIEPIFAGKPAPYMFELACKVLGTAKKETLVVGDRLSTDIAGGQAAGMPVALVYSGVSTEIEGNEWLPQINIIASDLGSLVE